MSMRSCPGRKSRFSKYYRSRKPTWERGSGDLDQQGRRGEITSVAAAPITANFEPRDTRRFAIPGSLPETAICRAGRERSRRPGLFRPRVGKSEVPWAPRRAALMEEAASRRLANSVSLARRVNELSRAFRRLREPTMIGANVTTRSAASPCWKRGGPRVWPPIGSE
jgi:hypothetical protein